MKKSEFVTDIKVGGKTPEEIKRGLEGCGGLDGDCENCPYDEQTIYCNDRLMRDALAYIQQLESRLAQAERERDAALHDFLRDACEVCKHGETALDDCRAPYTQCKFEWRGVCPENTKVKHIPENCRNYTIRAYDGMGCCLGTKEIDPCKGENFENWKPKEE